MTGIELLDLRRGGRTIVALAVLAGAVWGCAEPAPVSTPWPGWRGPGGVGLARDAKLPVAWSADSDNLRWRAELPGEGNSSPVVAGGRVFLTAARPVGDDRMERLALALDLASGELLWQTAVTTDRREHISPHNTFAAPTPATDGRRLYVFFGGTLGALDLDGELLWAREVDPRYADESHYGAASSVVLTDGAVIVGRDREVADEGVGWLGAFDKESGDELWRESWDHTCCSYVTPFLLERAAGPEVLYTHAGAVVSYDPESGKKLWEHALRMNQPVTGPVAEGDLLVVFSGADRVRNGAVLRLTGSGSETRSELLWETQRMISQASSPVLYDGRLYTVTDNGVMLCYDVESGQVLWNRRLARGGYRASLLAGDGKVYAYNSIGTTTVLEAGDRFRKLAENTLGEGASASPAWADPCLLLRTDQALYCIEAGDAETQTQDG